MSKATLAIDDEVMRRLRDEAARRGATPSEVAEEALRQLLDVAPRTRRDPVDLPTFRGGGPLVDISDRDALYDAMEGT
jgi:hypothetical protein